MIFCFVAPCSVHAGVFGFDWMFCRVFVLLVLCLFCVFCCLFSLVCCVYICCLYISWCYWWTVTGNDGHIVVCFIAYFPYPLPVFPIFNSLPLFWAQFSLINTHTHTLSHTHMHTYTHTHFFSCPFRFTFQFSPFLHFFFLFP